VLLAVGVIAAPSPVKIPRIEYLSHSGMKATGRRVFIYVKNEFPYAREIALIAGVARPGSNADPVSQAKLAEARTSPGRSACDICRDRRPLLSTVSGLPRLRES